MSRSYSIKTLREFLATPHVRLMQPRQHIAAALHELDIATADRELAWRELGEAQRRIAELEQQMRLQGKS